MVAERLNPGTDDQVIQEGKIFAVLGYLGLLCLIPLLAKKDNRFALFHAKQGLVLLIASVVTGWIPFLGWFILVPIIFVISVIGIVQALMGNYWKIPLVGDLAEKIKI